MWAELHPLGRPARTVVVGETARRSTRSAVVWGLLFGLLIANEALTYDANFPTVESRATFARTMGSNTGLTAIIGPARQVDQIGSFVAWRVLWLVATLSEIWALLLTTRLLRGEEDAGRWELVLSGRTARRHATGQALVGLAVGWLTLALVLAGRRDLGSAVLSGWRPASTSTRLLGGPHVLVAQLERWAALAWIAGLSTMTLIFGVTARAAASGNVAVEEIQNQLGRLGGRAATGLEAWTGYEFVFAAAAVVAFASVGQISAMRNEEEEGQFDNLFAQGRPGVVDGQPAGVQRRAGADDRPGGWHLRVGRRPTRRWCRVRPEHPPRPGARGRLDWAAIGALIGLALLGTLVGIASYTRRDLLAC